MARCNDKMNGRKLTEKVTLRTRVQTRGSTGAYTETTTDYSEWAAVEPLGGREVREHLRVRPGEAFKVTIRFKGDANDNPFYTNDNRVIVRTREMAIESVVDVKDEHRWLEIRAVMNKST